MDFKFLKYGPQGITKRVFKDQMEAEQYMADKYRPQPKGGTPNVDLQAEYEAGKAIYNKIKGKFGSLADFTSRDPRREEKAIREFNAEHGIVDPDVLDDVLYYGKKAFEYVNPDYSNEDEYWYDWLGGAHKKEKPAPFTPKMEKPKSIPKREMDRKGEEIANRFKPIGEPLKRSRTIGKGGRTRMARRRRFGRRRFGRKRRGGGKAVTFQRDVVNTYRKGRVNRRRLRRSKRSARMFNSKLLKYQGNNTIKREGSIVVSSNAGLQGINIVPGAFSFYGTAGTWDDLQAIYNAMLQKQEAGVYALSGGITATPSITQSSFYNALTGTASIYSRNKYYIRNCLMEMDICNTAVTPCVVEIYLCRARKTNSEMAATPMTDLAVNTLQVAGGVPMSTGLQYFTPFDSTRFCSLYKILSCKKVYLQPGGATDLSMKMKGMTFDPKELAGVTANSKGCYEGKSLFWVIVGTGAPEYNTGNPQFSASQLSITWQKQYNVKVVGSVTPTTVTLL